MFSISGQSYLKFLDLDQSPFIKTTESLLIDTVKIEAINIRSADKKTVPALTQWVTAGTGLLYVINTPIV